MARFEIANLNEATLGGAALSADILFEFGMLYSTGRDVELDLVAAHKWFNLSAMGGNERAKDYRSDIARELTSAEKARALREAREWMQCH